MTKSKKKAALQWQNLPSLPKSLAGQFVGTCSNKLIVLGGTHWTSAPWEGGKKLWSNEIYTLQKNDAAWRKIGTQSLSLSYVASISTQNSVICIGGQTANEASSKVFQIRINGDQIETVSLPDLPRPSTMISAAMIGEVIYVAGGQSSPNSQEAMCAFWSLELSDRKKKQKGWTELEPFPGVPRILPVAVNYKDSLFLFSGAELVSSASGLPTRRYLNDAYRFNLEKGWQQLKDLPQPIVAAPAICSKHSTIFVLGGDDGTCAHRNAELKEAHPGFNRACYSYRPETDEWAQIGEMPVGLVTTGVIEWDYKIVMAGGEDYPGSRSSQVIAAPIASF